MSHPDPHTQQGDNGQPVQVVNAQNARQGRNGKRTFVMLIISVGAAALLLLGWWAINNANLKQTEDETSALPEPAAISSANPA